jgi:phage tail-like protein
MSDIKLLGSQRQLFPKHQFLVDVKEDMSQGFEKCSELSFDVAKIDYWEGGSMIPWKVPGRVTFADVTLTRGACTSIEFYEWATQVANASVGLFPTRGWGMPTPGYIVPSIRIKQLDRDGKSVLRAWEVHNAWVQKFIAGEWDNSADGVVIESMTLAYDYFELVPL